MIGNEKKSDKIIHKSSLSIYQSAHSSIKNLEIDDKMNMWNKPYILSIEIVLVHDKMKVAGRVIDGIRIMLWYA